MKKETLNIVKNVIENASLLDKETLNKIVENVQEVLDKYRKKDFTKFVTEDEKKIPIMIENVQKVLDQHKRNV